MDIRKVKKLIELLEESSVAEIEIKEGEESVRISRHPSGAMPTHAPQPMSYGRHRPPQRRGRRRRARPRRPTAPSPRSTDQAVTAPMVGTFYRAPSPGAKPFVEIGRRSSRATRSASSRR